MEEAKVKTSVPGPEVRQQQQQQQPTAATTTAASAPLQASSKQPAAQETSAERLEPETSSPAEAASASSSSAAASRKSASSSTRRSPPASLNIDKTKPRDFDGELLTTNELPAAEVLKQIENYIVLDRHGKTHTFKSLYTGRNVARRVLVIFVRHFFCGNCQEYLRTLSESVTPEALLRLPISSFITVVGCGDPGLIDMYAAASNCPFPIYTDPTRSLFDALGMVKTLSLGAKPAYARKSLSRVVVDSFVQALKFVPKGMAHKSGDHRQVGGEFLFEPFEIATPITTPRDEQHPQIGSLEGREHGDGNGDDPRVEEKRVTWCHRMKTTRDHVEVPELMEVLGLDGEGQPIKEAPRTRKGTGLSMASQMSQLKEAAETAQQAQQAQQAQEAQQVQETRETQKVEAVTS